MDVPEDDEHPMAEVARVWKAEIERLGFASEEELVESFLQWEKERRQKPESTGGQQPH